MPRAKTRSSKPLSKGNEMEMRVARLWFWEGYFSRCGINLKHHYHPEPLVVTDLDLLAYDFGPCLQTRRTISEVKTGRGRSAPKTLDRIIWLRGLKEIVGVDHAELVSSINPSPRARDLARSIGVSAQSLADIEHREQLADIPGVEDTGSHGTKAYLERKWVRKHCSCNQDLGRAFWFLRSEVWFHDDITACKRLIGLFKQLAAMWIPEVKDDDSRALRWLLAETVSVFTLNVVAVAAEAIRAAPDLLAAELGDRLSAGLAPADVMRRIAADVDKYIGGVLTAAKAPAVLVADAMGAMQPEPPQWTEQFIDLVSRIAAEREKARLLPRQADLLVHERVVRKRHVGRVPYDRAALADPETGRLIRLVAAFLRSQSAHVEVIDRALTSPIRAAGQATDTEQDKPPEVSNSEQNTDKLPPVQASLLESCSSADSNSNSDDKS